jgi:hypothetical protein
MTLNDDKSKRQHNLPNRQLALVFNFSAIDLGMNRAGYMTWAQEHDIPIWQREKFAWLGRYIRWFRPRKQKSISHICGKVKLTFEMKQYYSARQTMIQDTYQLILLDSGFVFGLSQEQYHTISERVAYHIYFLQDSRRILSLERAVKGCSEG